MTEISTNKYKIIPHNKKDRQIADLMGKLVNYELERVSDLVAISLLKGGICPHDNLWNWIGLCRICDKGDKFIVDHHLMCGISPAMRGVQDISLTMRGVEYAEE